MEDHKSQVREKVWSQLRQVALPDSRFHFDFKEFIADFRDSNEAIRRIVTLPCYQSAKTVFITPDNCLEHLRCAALDDGKVVLVTTYAIRRGFWLLSPDHIPSSKHEYASTLDGMEKLGKPICLNEMTRDKLSVDLLVTGTGAINMAGVRFGKGHGFFDIEWAILYTLGVVSSQTPTAAIVHDCQVLTEVLEVEKFDTICDFVVTPTRIIEVSKVDKPKCGILWPTLAKGMLETIPPLQELKQMLDTGQISPLADRRFPKEQLNPLLL
ncbi:hypothetical protein MMC19_005748 [Ptychographa xylographoides]|nr:hypothetical protein [Ptychographa xylographoides]